RIDRLPYAQRQAIFSAYFTSSLLHKLSQAFCLVRRRFGREPRSNYDELIASHSRNVVVLTATLLQHLRKAHQHAIPFQVPEAVVDLLKSVHVADHHSERRVISLAPRKFVIELQE